MAEEVLPIRKIMDTDPAHARGPHSSKYDQGSAFVVDHYCPVQEASVPLVSDLVLHSDAVYDVVSVSKGNFFRLDYHQDRFARSCNLTRIKHPFTREQEAEILNNLVALTGLKEAFVFWMVARQLKGERGHAANPDAWDSHFYGFVIDYLFLNDDEQRARGVDFIISKQLRISPKAVNPQAKNFHWMDLNLSLHEAGDRGAEYSVLPNEEGNLTECPGSNIFVVKDGELYTPAEGCLLGGTRDAVIELCKDLGIPCHVTDVPCDQLRQADEAFMTSTAGGIMPANRVDDRLLGDQDGPGEITTRLHNLYWERRWDGWRGVPVDYTRQVV